MRKIILLIIVSICILFVSVFILPKFINPFNLDDTGSQIIFSIRLPRVIVSILMGSALGVSGAILQGLLRNPLADPYILGISSGATLMAAAGLIFGKIIFGLFTIPLLAFIGAISTGIAVGIMGYKGGGLLPERLLLAGIGIGFLFSSILMLLMSISADDPYGLIFIFAGFLLSIWRVKGLNALILGDEIAYSLGFSPFKERLILFISVGLMTASSVSLGGIVGFIGLLIPHIVRYFVGSDCRFLLPSSALAGGILLCMADTIGRTIMSPTEIPAGIITAIIGAPYFLYLLRRKEIMGV
ncbi:MAG: hypothetical protein A2W77_08265 [Nitrospinae bacterium RIFCSPLOWO2_12_39_16]|nr:MAG: hypothetical protein A2W77_08265 [Nitrospinae bacterium RIFCSPLOWO2_12_39_16]